MHADSVTNGGGALMHTPVGNYNYASPEALIAGGYDHTLDWWCIGIMFFHFLAGRTPFEGDTKEATQVSAAYISDVCVDAV